MIKNNISMTVKTLKAMRDNPSKDTIDFNSPIQRKSGMWDDKRKSLLLHSIMMGSLYSVPTVYFRKDMVAEKKYQYSVIDGIQRLTTIFSFVDNEFPLTEVPPVVLDGVTYDVSGKYFSDLEQDCQQEIIRFKMRIEAFEPEDGDSDDYVNTTIEEIFSRINSAVPLTSAQLCKAKAGTDVAIMLNKLLTSKFFMESCCFSKGQLKASDDQRCLLQAMMLLDRNYVPDFELKDFSETSLMEYSERIKGNYTDRQKNILKSAVEYLAASFPEKNKQLKKINIPMLIYLADYAMDKNIKPMYMRSFWDYFLEEDSLYEDYKTFCGSGSTKIEKVNGRLAIMFKSFCKYQDVDMPEELTEIVEKVDKLLEERKAEQEAQQNESLLTDATGSEDFDTVENGTVDTPVTEGETLSGEEESDTGLTSNQEESEGNEPDTSNAE